MDGARVVVVGGTGFYGRYVVADLLRLPDVEVVVAARHPPRHGFDSPRVRMELADHRDVAALREVVAGAAAVVHCAGPFQAMERSQVVRGHGAALPLGPLRAALAEGVPYVDIAEDRAFRREAVASAASATVPVLTGASVVPGLQTLIVADLASDLDRVDTVACAAAPDTRRHRGPAMFEAMMHGAGLPFTAPRGGVATRVHGWSEPEWTTFPPPVGRRLVHQVYEMADLDVMPELYGAGTVSFKAGTEHAAVNRMLGAFAAVRARTGRPRRPERLTAYVRGLSWLVGRAGDEAGAFQVSVTGERAGERVRRGLGMTSRLHGGRIPSLLAGIGVAELLAGRLTTPGVVPLDSWLPPERLYAALAEREVDLWDAAGDGWLPR